MLIAFKPNLSGLAGQTACVLLGICGLLAGGRASAQSLGSPVPVQEDAPIWGANLENPQAVAPPPAFEDVLTGVPDPARAVAKPSASGQSIPPPRRTWTQLLPAPVGKRASSSLLQPAAAQQLVPDPGQVIPWGGVREQGRAPFPPMIRLEIPGTQALFRLESEKQLQQRMRQEALQREAGKKLYFPDDRIALSPLSAPAPRTWRPMPEIVEPADMGFRRLFFYQINFDRYGWDLGPFQPAVSTGIFYFDVLTFPLQLAMDPVRRFEYNTGWFLPGDPAPLALYPFGPK